MHMLFLHLTTMHISVVRYQTIGATETYKCIKGVAKTKYLNAADIYV